jgi:hypothetical protein
MFETRNERIGNNFAAEFKGETKLASVLKGLFKFIRKRKK